MQEAGGRDVFRDQPSMPCVPVLLDNAYMRQKKNFAKLFVIEDTLDLIQEMRDC